MAQTDNPTGKLSIVSVTKLTTRARDGIGFDIVIQNPTTDTSFVRSTRIKGRVEARIAGAAPAHNAFTYDITLNSYYLMEDNMQLEADVSEPDEKDWVIPGKGQFTYEFSTARGHELWEYELSIVTPAEVSAVSRTRLRLLFRRGDKKVVKEVNQGYTPAWTTFPGRLSEHCLTLILEDGATIDYPVEDDFLSFIANW